MRHTMHISLTNTPSPDAIFESKPLMIGTRLWRRLFGKHRIVVLVPGGSVDTVTISEIGEHRHESL